MNQMMSHRKVLVVGGAGYIGATTCAWLMDRGHEVWVLDDFSTGHRDFVLPHNRLLNCRAGDHEKVSKFFKQEHFDCVMHFAAKALVSESVQKPKEYFENNVLQTEQLLATMLENGIKNFVFSSTCAIFGDPGSLAIEENLIKRPLNPYGETKLAVEVMLSRLASDQGLNSIALRYFNAAGAEPRLRVGEWHEPETHLIPCVFDSILNDRPVSVYGTNYSTPDGTCIRDYIHVWDLALAHEAAMERLFTRTAGFEAFNLGSENGYSVREVINACSKVIGTPIKVIEKPRRPGDPPRLVADSKLAQKSLNFKINYSLEQIIESAWNWENKKIISTSAKYKAIFLDRDGTLNEDPGYLHEASKLHLLTGVAEGLKALEQAGYLLVIVSNQSGVGRGIISQEELVKVHKRLDELLALSTVKIDHYELCLHTPEQGCACRKPKPKLIFEAARKLGIDLSKSYFVGDKKSDLLAGRAAGCKGTILVRTGYGAEVEKTLQVMEADFIGDDLLAVARWILNQGTANP